MASERSDLSVSLATVADVEDMASILLSVFGKDTPENRAKTVRALVEDIHENSGLKVVKAELPHGEAVGFSMFFFPNREAPTKEKTIPTPLRSVDDLQESTEAIMDRFFWVEGSDPVKTAVALDRFGRQEIQKHVAGRTCANVQNMCVKPEYQHRGIGRALMAWACQKFDEEHLDAHLEASGPGEKLYQKFGFRVIGHSEKDFGDGLKVAYTHMWRNAESPSA
ncbi:putative N-acetyltransferase domain-containing protein [Seiridium unicorne]|uniref:N-acetyltransferase domain-containing protein n=1 Tax=Seiridium unicorne TaxID=138068 RepID=A0ABR2UTT0_9PEZI